MRKTYIVKEAKDFENIIKKGKCRKNQSFVIHFKKNNLPYDKYGISVSKKLGNAVFRNKYKRKLRSIIENYRKSKNVKELSSLLPDKIIQNVINNNYERIEKKTQLLKNIYYIVNAEFSQETKMFEIRVEYLNLKDGETTSESDV